MNPGLRGAACHRWLTSQALLAPPCPLHPPPRDPVDPQGGGGSRRSLLLPPWLADSRERSASPRGWATLWGARLAGCFLLPLAPARRARARAPLARDAPALPPRNRSPR